MFNKDNLKKIGKAGANYAKDYVKEESKSFLSELLQGLIIKFVLIIVFLGAISYFGYKTFYYLDEKVEAAKEATTNYVSEKKNNVITSVNNTKESITNTITETKNNTITSVNQAKEDISSKATNIKEELVKTFDKSVEDKLNYDSTENKADLIETKEEVIETKEEVIETKEENKFSLSGFANKVKEKASEVKENISNSSKE